jgi:hypothetical protein
MPHMHEHALRHRSTRERLVALSDEWARLDGRAHDLQEQRPAQVTVNWILRRKAVIRQTMLETPAATMAGVGAKHRIATAHGNGSLDEDLLESAENDVVRLVYG